jgi:excisionase family DNA binding protein
MVRLIDIDELADYLKLKRQTIYNWLHQGKISGIKVGGVWRFDRREVDKWLRSRKRLSKELKEIKSGEKQ